MIKQIMDLMTETVSNFTTDTNKKLAKLKKMIQKMSGQFSKELGFNKRYCIKIQETKNSFKM